MLSLPKRAVYTSAMAVRRRYGLIFASFKSDLPCLEALGLASIAQIYALPRQGRSPILVCTTAI